MVHLLLLWLRVQHSYMIGEGDSSPFFFMFNEIGNIVVIGLEARTDRWKRCKEIFKENEISPVTHYATVQDFKDSHRHYMKDFLQMLRVKGTGDLVFFEDDFELVPGWEDVLRKAWKELPEDFDMLYLGCNPQRSLLKVTDNLVKIQGAWLMHACILSHRFIEYILSSYDLNQIWIIDEWYRQIAPQRKFYMTYPMISYQREDFSDMLGQYVKYDIFNNKFYKEYEDSCNGSRLSATT
jgi:hypothetical protein